MSFSAHRHDLFILAVGRLELKGQQSRPECAQQPNELEAGLNHGYSVQAPSPVAVFRPRTVFPPFPQEVSSKGSCLVGIFFRAP